MRAKPRAYKYIVLSAKQITLRPYRLSDYANCKSSHEERLPAANSFEEPIPRGKRISRALEGERKKF